MERTPENVAWALGKLSLFAGLLGYPAETAALVANANQLLDIVKDRELWDWLVDVVLKFADRFPAPIVFRRAYAVKHKPADGLEPYDVLKYAYPEEQ